MNYPTIIFDVGGTLLHFNHTKLAQVYRDYARAQGILLDRVRVETVLQSLERELPTRSKQRALSLEKDSGAAFWDEFYTDGFRRLGVEGDVSGVVAEIRSRFMRGEFESRFPDALPTLDALKARGVNLGILSNFSANLEDVLCEQALYSYFDFFVVSAVAGVEKPDRRIFDLAVNAAQRPREQVVYVGDSIFHDIDGARNAGIAGILIDRANAHREYAGARVQSLNELIPILEKEETSVQV